MKAGAIILSGGKSSRMGTNKALLKFHEKTNIERIKDELKHVFDDIILVTNDPETYQFLNIKTVTDQYPGSGPLAGIHAGLEASDYEENFVVACDMPFVSAELASSLVKALKHHDAVVPVSDGRQHPLFAAYQKRVAGDAKACIEEGTLRLKHMLENLNVRYLAEEDLRLYCERSLERVFFNMNRPEEYEDAKKWAESGE
ncbi:molybdenum cofactor guanylyltransferase [Mesobacillus subterraneus]|uniref:molybdenum cofactor guanylyltransferase n=1 Tax=Mesobacillus subterraneus TaxID=285983 RepID=UPI00203FA912|nr:molybdenum cofactor guanylyltransferase [Mesobacillus subterraneus]MCM3664562.1 molybdenum cofactor guanylyltransferase [Mesobacillus subterraneus]MCM3683922.1 molybdenum cofactor guanylyltransferase [Mesobacillus subterraneus]